MWYLQTDVLLRLFIACGAMILISGLSRLIFKKDFGPKVLVFASIAVIAYVSWQLAIAIVCYTLITFIFARILKPLKKTRRFFFVLFSILCTVPFFYGRMTEFFPQLPVIITFVGIAYHMLKAVDVMYFVYYTDMDIPFLTYVNYMLFFPTFTAGPIFRYRDFQKVYNKPVPLTTDRFITCVKRFIKGMFKKMVVLYFVSTFFNFLVASEKHWYVSLAIVVFSYLFLFFDLSGYSDMAIGLGRMLGFHFGENFEYPYISRSITEFWRRWHISLSTFFRDYVYIPLGGNRYHAIRNIFIVWLLTGLRHGASWNFIFWGLFYGVLLFIEKTLFKKKLQKIPAPICYIYTMFFVILGWALFYFTDLNALWTFIKSAFGVGTALYDLTAVSTFCTNAWLIAVCVIASTPIPTIIHKNFCKKSKVFAAISEPVLVIVGLGVCFVLLVGQTYNPFLYFRF